MFRVGDRVIAKYGIDDMIPKGETGVVSLCDDPSIGVVWDEFVGGHTLGGFCENGCGWWVLEDDIALLEEAESDIESDISDLL